jgi:hypothetical protein
VLAILIGHPTKDIEHVVVQGLRNGADQFFARVGEFEADRPAITEVPAARDVPGPFQTVEYARDGLALLGQVIGHQVWLRPIERVDREKRYGLDKGDIVITPETLIELPYRGIRGPVQ